VKLVLASSEFGRPFAAPPGMAADRLKIFREAHNKAMKDPALLIEAKHTWRSIRPPDKNSMRWSKRSYRSLRTSLSG
jgi:hypothetical protein